LHGTPMPQARNASNVQFTRRDHTANRSSSAIQQREPGRQRHQAGRHVCRRPARSAGGSEGENPGPACACVRWGRW